jgi:hypothetical protein
MPDGLAASFGNFYHRCSFLATAKIALPMMGFGSFCLVPHAESRQADWHLYGNSRGLFYRAFS